MATTEQTVEQSPHNQAATLPSHGDLLQIRTTSLGEPRTGVSPLTSNGQIYDHHETSYSEVSANGQQEIGLINPQGEAQPRTPFDPNDYVQHEPARDITEPHSVPEDANAGPRTNPTYLPYRPPQAPTASARATQYASRSYQPGDSNERPLQTYLPYQPLKGRLPTYNPVPADPSLVTPLEQVSLNATRVDCPRCRAPVMTTTQMENGDRTCVIAAILCLCGCALCAWIPCVMDDFKDTQHNCSKCRLPLARVTSSGTVTVLAPASVVVQSQYAQSQYAPPQQMSAVPQQQTNAVPQEKYGAEQTRTGTPAAPAEMHVRRERHEMYVTPPTNAAAGPNSPSKS